MPMSPKLVAEASPADLDAEASKEARRALKAERKRQRQIEEEAEEKAAEEKAERKRLRREAKAAAASAEVVEEKATNDETQQQQQTEKSDSSSVDAFRAQFEIKAAKEGQQLPDPIQRFEDAPFGPKVQKALASAGFTSPSPIQAQGWPIAIAGDDLVAVAKTGSGKTLGFLLPAFKSIATWSDAKLSDSNRTATPLVLVLAPTRELGAQIEAECVKFGSCTNARAQCVFGGVPKPPQVQALKNTPPHILVATPGRLQDLMQMGAIGLSNVRLVVLDEADRMLDMGFEPEIAKILEGIPKTRQTLLYSATWPKSVQKIASKYLKADFVHVNVGETEDLSANKSVTQEFHKLGDDEKDQRLWKIFSGLPDNAKVIAFGNTKRRVEQVKKTFWEKGFEGAALHGDKSQAERDQSLRDFTTGKVWLLFATDVCARGLDIKDVTHVINFDMARDVESYVHRIGRTGRAGNKGTSITFWNPAYDMECSPALVKIAKEASQPVPEWLENAAAKQKTVKNKLWRY